MIDTHCHLDHRQFDNDRDAVIARSVEAGVDGWIIPAVTPHSTRLLLQAPWRTARVWATVGIHPHDVKDHGPGHLEEIENLLLSFPELVAVGECGLDYFYDHADRESQIRLFEGQLDLAEKFQRPVIVHARDGVRADAPRHSAYADILDLVRDRKVTGVLHSFTGTPAFAEQAVALGWYIGVGGISTFKQSEALRDVLRQVPRDHLLLETDAPYLAPIPHRGKRNEPAYLVKTLSALATLKAVEPEEAEAFTSSNAQRLFRLT